MSFSIDAETLYNHGQADYTIYNWLFRSSRLSMHYGLWYPETKSLSEAQGNTNRYVLKQLQPVPGQRLVDMGCGVGSTALFLARAKISVVAITISGYQAEQARRYASMLGLQHLACFEKQDFHRTEFEAEGFDYAYSVESANHARPIHAYLAEAYRLLKPGGKLLIVDAYLRQPLAEYTVEDQRAIKNFCGVWAIANPNTRAYWTRQMREAGFHDVGYEVMTERILKTTARIKFVGRLFQPLYSTLYRMRLLHKARYANCCAAIMQADLFRNGLLEYCALWGTKPVSAD